jgi:exodeoxyribonuclease VII small subunit
MPKLKELKFEDQLKRLEHIVTQLETKDVALEESLGFFEEGIGLARACQKKLTDARRKVEILVKETGGLKPFDAGEDENPS